MDVGPKEQRRILHPLTLKAIYKTFYTFFIKLL